MKVWAIANQKGGVGKTTTAVTLAGFLAKLGHPTLMVDLDPHGSLSAYFNHDPEAQDAGVYRLFLDMVEGTSSAAEEICLPTGIENLDIMPASMALATLDRRLGMRDGMGLVVSRALKNLQTRYEYVLLDCPPVLGVLMVNALAACDKLIIPVQSEFLAIKGLERMMKTLQMITKARHQPVEHVILPTMYDKRTRASEQAMITLRNDYPEELWEGVIPVDTQFREASKKGVPLSTLRPYSKGGKAYRKFLEHLLQDEWQPQTAVGG